MFGEYIMQTTIWSFKIFWDGSLSLFPETQAIDSNKAVVSELLRVWDANLDWTEPIYTLAHGQDTDTAIQHAHQKIKMEQLEAKEN